MKPIPLQPNLPTPTNCFGKPVPASQWYVCPNCKKESPLTKKRVGLTDEEIEDEWERVTGHSIFGGDKSEGRAMYLSADEVIEFARAIEAKLKEKNGY